jgi:hypothetical protein
MGQVKPRSAPGGGRKRFGDSANCALSAAIRAEAASNRSAGTAGVSHAEAGGFGETAVAGGVKRSVISDQ